MGVGFRATIVSFHTNPSAILIFIVGECNSDDSRSEFIGVGTTAKVQAQWAHLVVGIEQCLALQTNNQRRSITIDCNAVVNRDGGVVVVIVRVIGVIICRMVVGRLDTLNSQCVGIVCIAQNIEIIVVVGTKIDVVLNVINVLLVVGVVAINGNISGILTIHKQRFEALFILLQLHITHTRRICKSIGGDQSLGDIEIKGCTRSTLRIVVGKNTLARLHNISCGVIVLIIGGKEVEGI